MMSDTVRSIHLLLEDLGRAFHGTPPPARNTVPENGPVITLKIGDGVSYLSLASRKEPSLKRRSGRNPGACVVLEPVRKYPTAKLLMLIPEGVTARVNGTPAPRVSLLEEKDEISFDRLGRYVLHVAFYHTPRIGYPDKEEIGKKCPICRSRFTRDTIVYRCHNCSKPLHYEEDQDTSPKKRLDCAGISTECPACHMEIRMNSGYRYLPDFITK